jgi:hypothetical protein
MNWKTKGAWVMRQMAHTRPDRRTTACERKTSIRQGPGWLLCSSSSKGSSRKQTRLNSGRTFARQAARFLKRRDRNIVPIQDSGSGTVHQVNANRMRVGGGKLNRDLPPVGTTHGTCHSHLRFTAVVKPDGGQFGPWTVGLSPCRNTISHCGSTTSL